MPTCSPRWARPWPRGWPRLAQRADGGLGGRHLPWRAGLAFTGPAEPGRATTVGPGPAGHRGLALAQATATLHLPGGDVCPLVRDGRPPRRRTSTTRAQPRLERLAGENLLVQPIGGDPPAWRYHNLPATTCGRTECCAGGTTDLHVRAAQWYVEQGVLDSSTEHGPRERRSPVGGNVRYVGRAVDLPPWPCRHALRALDQFTIDELAADPSLRGHRRRPNALTGRPGTPTPLADVVERAATDVPLEERIGLLESGRADAASGHGSGWHERGPGQRAARRGAGAARQPVARARPLAARGGARFIRATGRGGGEIGGGRGGGAAFHGDRDGHPRLPGVALGRARGIERGRRPYRGGWGPAPAASFGSISLPAPSMPSRRASPRARYTGGVPRPRSWRPPRVRPLCPARSPGLGLHVLGDRPCLRGRSRSLPRSSLCARPTTSPGYGRASGPRPRSHHMREVFAGAVDRPGGSPALTAAELRVLPYLPTYLSFHEIAGRLLVSRNPAQVARHQHLRQAVVVVTGRGGGAGGGDGAPGRLPGAGPAL